MSKENKQTLHGLDFKTSVPFQLQGGNTLSIRILNDDETWSEWHDLKNVIISKERLEEQYDTLNKYARRYSQGLYSYRQAVSGIIEIINSMVDKADDYNGDELKADLHALKESCDVNDIAPDFDITRGHLRDHMRITLESVRKSI